MVTIGDTAIFQCNAKGSNISVRWMINGSPCGPDSCEQNGTFISTKTDNNSFMINTTLEIRTSELNIEQYTIQCIVEQNLVSSLRGDNINITTTLSVYILNDLVSSKINHYECCYHHNYLQLGKNSTTVTLTVDPQQENSTEIGKMQKARVNNYALWPNR